MPANVSQRVSGLAAFLTLTIAASCAAQTAAAGFAWDRSPAALVLSYRDVWAELANPDPTPLIRIFGDGRVLVHHPEYTPRAGEYELTLPPAELEELLASLLDKGLATVEAAALARSKAAVEIGRWRAALAADRSPELFVVADDSTSVFELHLTSYRPAGSAAATGEIHRTLSWLGLATDAERYPESEPLVRLRAAELELRALLERPDLKRVRR